MADPRADLLLITVTTVETKAVLQAFREATDREPTVTPIGGKDYHDLGVVNGTRVMLVRSEPGTAVLGGAIQTVQKGIEALAPAAVIMVGIAFGVDEKKQAIGDVLVSKQLVAYEPQRVGVKGGEPHVIPRGSRVDCSPWLLGRCRSAELHWDGSEVYAGLVLSGEKLVDNLAFRHNLVAMEPEAVGGEMEGAGLYAACQDAKVDWILIKAICDWADGEKSTDKKARQALAARNAAAFVLELLDVAPITGDAQRADGPAPRFDRLGIGVAGSVSAGGDIITTATTYVGTTPEMPPAYSSIPTQPFFFGRVDELKTIAGAVHPEARTWGALIDGPGGIGKTALAIQAAHDAPGEHFDRKVFLSAKVRELRPSGEAPLDEYMLPNYLTLLTELARELGEDQMGRTSENERASAVRRALADRRVLIVVDNLETFPEAERDQLFQFLERLPRGCKAIVTSRRRSDVDARTIRLDRLKEAEALQLLDVLSETKPLLAAATDAERRQLYEATGGNPLLLRWTAGQLGRRESRCRTVTAAIAFLRAAPPGNDPLAYVFGDLLDTFTDDEAAVLAALTHFTLPAQTDWIADLARLSVMQAQTALEDLTDRALVMSDPEGRMFVLPGLAATFIRRARPEVVAQTGDRLDDRVYALVLENGNDTYDRFPTLDAQWPLIQAALPRFIRNAREGVAGETTQLLSTTDAPSPDSPLRHVQNTGNERLQHLCLALDDFMDFSGRWDEWLDLCEQAENIALARHNFHSAGWRACHIGHIHGLRQQSEAVIACANRAEAHWRTAGSGPREQASALLLRGRGHEIAENYVAARESYLESLAIHRSINPESQDVAMVLSDISDIDQMIGDIDASDRRHREALRIAKKVGANELIATQTSNRATLALRRKDWPEAERIAREALKMGETIGRQELIGRDCCCLTRALLEQGLANEALPHAQRAVNVFTQLRFHELDLARSLLRECEEAIAK